jgi:hypothetical protein
MIDTPLSFDATTLRGRPRDSREVSASVVGATGVTAFVRIIVFIIL